MLILIATSIFIAVALLTAAVLFPLLTRRTVVQERLAKLAPQKYETPTLIAQQTPWQDFLARIGERLPPPSTEQSRYAKSMVAAGFRKESVLIFIGCKILLTAAPTAAYVFFYALPHGIALNSESLLYTAALAIIGFLAPSVWLNRRVENRKTQIFHSLPDVLDLLTVCVEAGLSIDAAVIKTSENPQFNGNPLAEDLKIAAMETRAGKPRAEALKDVAERTMVEDIRSFVAMLLQTEKFGTSLSQALRIHADSLRTKRRQVAEEAAAKTAIKMLFPLVFCVFPALLVVMLGPAVFLFKSLFR